jgi:pyroglutamyl-peptidase
MAEAIKAVGVPSAVSYSAGAFVCNEVIYTLLEHYRASDVRVGFIHVPYSPEQKKEPSMDVALMVKALTAAIESID